MITKFDKYIYKIVSVIILIVGLGIIINVVIDLSKDNYRLLNNQDALLNQTKIIKAENGNLAYENKVLQLSLSEARDIVIPELQAEIKNLNLKLRHIESFSQNVVTISDTIKVPIHDTVIKTDSIFIDAKNFYYTDKFANIKGVVYTDSVELAYSIRDSIVQFVYRGKYNNWYDPLILRKRPLYQIITAKNPNTIINYCRVISIKKGRNR